MSSGERQGDSGDARNPRTRTVEPTASTSSYADALLDGRLTSAELDAIRGDLFGTTAVITEVPAPASVTGDDGGGDDDARTGSRLAESVLLDQLADCVGDRDYAGGLAATERLLAQHPGHPLALNQADFCREMLSRAYLAQLGSAEDLPRVAVGPEQLRAIDLDRWSAYLVACIDGRSTLEEVVDVSGFPRMDAFRLLFELAERGIVRVEPGSAALRR